MTERTSFNYIVSAYYTGYLYPSMELWGWPVEKESDFPILYVSPYICTILKCNMVMTERPNLSTI